MRSVTNHEGVHSVPQAAGQNHMRARPFFRLLGYAQVQGSADVGPSVVSVVRIVQPSSRLGIRLNRPVVAAETKWLGGKRRQGSNTLDNLYQYDRTTCSRRDIDGWRRTKTRIYQ